MFDVLNLIVGYLGKLEEKKIAIELRKNGLSYSQIKKQVNVSKDTLSRWCRDIAISVEQTEKLLKRKLRGSEKGRIIGSQKNHEKKMHEMKNLMQKGKEEIGSLSKRERFLIGVALYASEGTKTDKHVVFTNSDPKLIKFMSNWFREFCNIKEEKIKGRLWIHENQNEEKARKYWSILCNIPTNQFNKSYIAENKINSKKIRKHIHEYGIFGISISNAKIHRKIMGWIAGIAPEPMI